MSEYKKCAFCGRSFEDKGGFNESPRIKMSAFGPAHAVCSIKCKLEFEESKEQSKKKKSTESFERYNYASSEDADDSEYLESWRKIGRSILYLLLIILFVLAMIEIAAGRG